MISAIVSLIITTLKVMGAKRLFVMIIKIFIPDLKKWSEKTEHTKIDDNFIKALEEIVQEMEKN